MQTTIEKASTDIDPKVAADRDQVARDLAIRQIERRRRYWTSVVVSGIGMLFLVAIWAISEFHNAGGWPTHGFSQSSGIRHVWNMWILYPVLGWALLVAAGGWNAYLHKPISEEEIKREIERQARP